MFKCIFVNENVWIPIEISLKFVPINNNPALFQIMAWRRPGDKPLSEPMMVSLPTQICVIRPQWVKPLLSSIIPHVTVSNRNYLNIHPRKSFESYLQVGGRVQFSNVLGPVRLKPQLVWSLGGNHRKPGFVMMTTLSSLEAPGFFLGKTPTSPVTTKWATGQPTVVGNCSPPPLTPSDNLIKWLEFVCLERGCNDQMKMYKSNVKYFWWYV